MIVKKMLKNTMMVCSFIMVASLMGSLIDGIFIGRFLGKDCSAAYGLISPLVAIIALVGGILSSGATAYISRYIVKGERDKVNELFSMILIEAVVLFLVIGLGIWILRYPFVRALGATGNSEYLAPLMIKYLMGLIPSFLVLLLVEFLNSILQLEGDRIGSILNISILTLSDILFDALNIYVFKAGLFGMAMATSLSYYMGASVFLVHFLRKSCPISFRLRGLPWKEAATFFKTGLPNGISRLCTALRSIVLNKILVAVATSVSVAAFSVTLSFGTFATSVANGVGMSALMIAGICMADYDRKGMNQLIQLSLKGAFFATLMISAASFVFSDAVANVFFASSPEVAAEASRLIKFFSVYAPLFAVGNLFYYYLQGICNLKLSSFFCIFVNGFFVILLALPLGYMFGQAGVWGAFPLAGVLCVLLVVAAAWKHCGKFPNSFADYTFLDPDFDSGIQTVECSICKKEEVCSFSEEVQKICREYGADSRKAFLCALCVEEILNNTFLYGFSKTKDPCVDVKITENQGVIGLRFRDNGTPFNPVEFFSFHENGEPTQFIGLRLVIKSSSEIHYDSIMNYNNLTILF